MAAKLVLSLAFVACTLADPGYYGYGGYGAGYGYGGYGGYGYGRGVAGHYGGGRSYTYRSPQGIGKRSADAEPEAYYGAYGYGAYPAYGAYGYGYNTGVAAHPTGTSYTYRSPQGLRGKRSADAEPEAYYGGYSAYPAYGYGYGRGVASHYGGGSSYVYRSPQGLRGKRSADAEAYGYGYPAYGYARRGSYQSVSRPLANSFYSVNDRVSSASVYEDNFNGANGYFGRYKREADAEAYGYGYAGSFQRVSRPGSTYAVNDRVSSANVYERNANYGAAYGYGFNSGYYGY